MGNVIQYPENLIIGISRLTLDVKKTNHSITLDESLVLKSEQISHIHPNGNYTLNHNVIINSAGTYWK